MTPERQSKRYLTCMAVPLLVVLLLGIGLVVLWRQFVAAPKAEVQANSAQYDEVIRLIETGQITGGSPGGNVVMLPQPYQQLSAAENGEVIVYRDETAIKVLFYPRGQWVYMYFSQDKPFDESTDSCSVPERERPTWFWFQCYTRNP